MHKLLKLILLLVCTNSIAQPVAKDTTDPFVLLEQAYNNKDWLRVAQIQKTCYQLDKNPSRLFWSARCYAWLKDTNNTYKSLDSAIMAGYTNIYILDKDTAYAFLRQEQNWKVIRTKAFEKYKANEEVFYWGFYYGILAIIFVLNLVLFFSSKEPSYLFLCLMILADMHFEMFNNSSLKIYIIKLIPWMGDALVTRFPPPAVYVCTILISYILFSKSFLKLKSLMPRMNVVLSVFIGLFLIMLTDILLHYNFIPEIINQIIVSLAFIIPVILGAILWKRRYSEAKYFFIGAMILIAGLFAKDFVSIMIYSTLNFGILLFFITLSIGIGSKLSALQLEKERAQEKALEVLEEKVQERTTEVMKQKDEIIQQKHLVEEKQKEITDSINYAKRLQQAILPPQEFISRYVPDNFILYKPKDIVAGDFYWAEHIGTKFFIAAADSTGHGVPGAMVSVVCSNALNRSVKEFGLNETGKILDKTRELVIETFEKSGTDVKDGMDISLICIDKSNRKITWSGANNPLWYQQNKTLHEIKADKQAIGKTENPVSFTTHQIDYYENCTFYLFTDGLADQFGGPKGKKYKYKQFEELLVTIDDKPMQVQAEIINKSFEDWKASLEQVDDVCVIGIRL